MGNLLPDLELEAARKRLAANVDGVADTQRERDLELVAQADAYEKEIVANMTPDERKAYEKSKQDAGKLTQEQQSVLTQELALLEKLDDKNRTVPQTERIAAIKVELAALPASTSTPVASTPPKPTVAPYTKPKK